MAFCLISGRAVQQVQPRVAPDTMVCWGGAQTWNQCPGASLWYSQQNNPGRRSVTYFIGHQCATMDSDMTLTCTLHLALHSLSTQPVSRLDYMYYNQPDCWTSLLLQIQTLLGNFTTLCLTSSPTTKCSFIFLSFPSILSFIRCSVCSVPNSLQHIHSTHSNYCTTFPVLFTLCHPLFYWV